MKVENWGENAWRSRRMSPNRLACLGTTQVAAKIIGNNSTNLPT